MAVVASNVQYPVEKVVKATIAFDSSYPTGGEQITAAQFGLARFTRIIVNPTGATAGGFGYLFDPTIAASGLTANIIVGLAPGVTATGTVAAPTFTGQVPGQAVNYGTPVFSGTGQTSAGQVITTTDNQTMTLNQCAGMWFVSATHGPYLIASNTAVTGAPAVLTIYGDAPTTDAGTYKILTGVTPTGTNSAPAFTGSATTASTFVELANATNLAALTAVPIYCFGY